MRKNLANYGDAEFSVFLRKAFIKALGYTDDALGRPIIGIVDTNSGYNACHSNIPDLIEAAKRGEPVVNPDKMISVKVAADVK